MKKYKPSPSKKHTQSSDRYLGESSVDSFSPNPIEVTDEVPQEEPRSTRAQKVETKKPIEENLKNEDVQEKPTKSKLWSLFGSKTPKSSEPSPMDHHESVEETVDEPLEEPKVDLMPEPEAEVMEVVEPEIVQEEPEVVIPDIKPEPVSEPTPEPEPEVKPEPLPQLESVEVIKVETESSSDQKEEMTEETNLNVDHNQEKAKPRLWGAFKSKESEPRILPQHESNKDTSEEKRVTMRTNEYPDLNSVSSKEPNAVISKMMVITGNVKLDTSLLLAGKVVGNIECEDHIEVRSNGAVEGNISAHSIKLSGGNIKGNITCEGTLETDMETVIVGDVSASVILVSGKVTGEIRAKESVSLTATAVVKGDLYSALISVEKGAFLEGKYSVSKSLD